MLIFQQYAQNVFFENHTFFIFLLRIFSEKGSFCSKYLTNRLKKRFLLGCLCLKCFCHKASNVLRFGIPMLQTNERFFLLNLRLADEFVIPL